MDVASPPSPDLRPLPSGWAQHYDAECRIWFYIRLDVVPPQVSFVHPASVPSLSVKTENLTSKRESVKAVDPPAKTSAGLSFAQSLYANALRPALEQDTSPPPVYSSPSISSASPAVSSPRTATSSPGSTFSYVSSPSTPVTSPLPETLPVSAFYSSALPLVAGPRAPSYSPHHAATFSAGSSTSSNLNSSNSPTDASDLRPVLPTSPSGRPYYHRASTTSSVRTSAPKLIPTSGTFAEPPTVPVFSVTAMPPLPPTQAAKPVDVTCAFQPPKPAPTRLNTNARIAPLPNLAFNIAPPSNVAPLSNIAPLPNVAPLSNIAPLPNVAPLPNIPYTGQSPVYAQYPVHTMLPTSSTIPMAGPAPGPMPMVAPVQNPFYSRTAIAQQNRTNHTAQNSEALKNIGVALGKTASKVAFRMGANALLSSVGAPTNLLNGVGDAVVNAAFKPGHAGHSGHPAASNVAQQHQQAQQAALNYQAYLHKLQQLQAQQGQQQQSQPGLDYNSILSNYMSSIQGQQQQTQPQAAGMDYNALMSGYINNIQAQQGTAMQQYQNMMGLSQYDPSNGAGMQFDMTGMSQALQDNVGNMMGGFGDSLSNFTDGSNVNFDLNLDGC